MLEPFGVRNRARSHRLVQSAHGWELRGTWENRLVVILMALVALGSCAGFFLVSSGWAFVLLLLGALFVVAVGLLAREAFSVTEIDLERRTVERSLGLATDRKNAGRTRSVRLSDVASLQLLSELDHEGDRYHALNLVMRDGWRVQLASHGELAELQRDATTLSESLRLELHHADAKR